MYRSSDLTDEPSRLKQFAWEQWDNQPFAVLFRPGIYGLDRYIVKRYAEQILSNSERWKQLSPYFSGVSPPIRAYTMTSYEIELMQRILDHHLNETIRLRITNTYDQLIEYEDLLDFIRRALDLSRANGNSNNRSISNKRTTVSTIPSILSSYILPPSTKSMIPVVAPPPPPPPKISPTKLIVGKSSPSAAAVPPLPNKNPDVTSTTTMKNGYSASRPSSICSTSDSASRLASTIQIKPNLISPPGVNCTYPNANPSSSSSSQQQLSVPLELCPSSLYTAKIETSGWVQINNVYLPFVTKNRQRLVPYQVLVSCKILETDELRSTLTRATLADATLMNRMIRECKIDNEEITENSHLVNVYHVLIGTKNLVYAKILPKDNPTSKINRQYKSVLALRGGSLYITYRTVPFVCSSNHSYIPLNDIISIYPHLLAQFKSLTRVPRMHEFDYLQLVQMYYNEKELPADTLLVDIQDLNQTQVIPSRNMTLIEFQAREKNKLEQQIALINSNSSTSSPTSTKRKNQEPHEKQRRVPSQPPPPPTTTTNNHYSLQDPPPPFIRPPTGYFPLQHPPPTTAPPPYPSQYQQHHWFSPSYGARGRTRWQ